MYHVIKYRRGIVRKNLTTSFPEKSEEEIIDIEKKFYRWFSDYFFEAVKLLSISDKELAPADSRYTTARKWSNVFRRVRMWQPSWGITATGSGSRAWASNCLSHARWASSITLCATKPSMNSSSASVLTKKMEWLVPKKDILRYLVDYKRKDILQHLRLHQRPGAQVGEHPPVASFPQPSRNPSVYWRRENHEKDERCRVLCRDVAPEARLLHGNLQAHHPRSELPAGARDYPSLLPDAGRNHPQESTLLFMDA